MTKPRKPVEHYEKVDKVRIKSIFLEEGQHRALLHLPYKERENGKTLCVLGQNPSYAGNDYADKTIRFVEELVFKRRPDVGAILMLNLYSLVDTTKGQQLEPTTAESDRYLRKAIIDHDEFLVIFGKLKRQGVFMFPERATELRPLFYGKSVSKLELGTSYAPHPGNRAITYSRYDIPLAPYDFSDLI